MKGLEVALLIEFKGSAGLLHPVHLQLGLPEVLAP